MDPRHARGVLDPQAAARDRYGEGELGEDLRPMFTATALLAAVERRVTAPGEERVDQPGRIDRGM